MKKLLLSAILGVFFVSILSAQNQQIKGSWILKDIQTDAIIYKAKNKSESIALTSNTASNVKPETEKIALRSYLLNEMMLDVTKFNFTEKTFQFFRKSELTFEGKFTIENNTIFMDFLHKGVENTKEMKLVSVKDNELVLESSSHNKPFTLIFKR